MTDCFLVIEVIKDTLRLHNIDFGNIHIFIGERDRKIAREERDTGRERERGGGRERERRKKKDSWTLYPTE